MSHSCGRYRIADHFTGKDPNVRRAYRRFVQLVRACGKVEIYAQKTRIVCMGDVRFAEVKPARQWIDFGLWLNRQAKHPAFLRSEPLPNDSFGCYFRFTDPAQMDDAFAALVVEAHACHSRLRRER
jgi:hypothetical protein